jgi:major membrane immunogen (membrane-anchored lipoprotein)
MIRIAAVVVLALGLAACGAVDTMTEGFKHAKAVESDLEASTGVRPQVGFNWRNGRLVQVTVSYPRLNETKPLHDLADAVRASVIKQFKQKPDNIVLAFAVAG